MLKLEKKYILLKVCSQGLKNVVMNLFCLLQGYRAEMDNPAMVILLPPILRNRKDVLFGNMPEIYDFHNKYDAGSVPPLCHTDFL